MNFDFSEDQQHLRSEARRFLEARCPASLVRQVLDAPQGATDPALWAELVSQGWTSLTLPEEYGGLGLSPVYLCVLAEELGRVLAPVPFASTLYLLAEALKLAGSPQQKRWLQAIAAGACVGCLAVEEGPGDPALARLQTYVEGERLSGAKLPVTDGMIATLALVLAKGPSGPQLFLVELNQRCVTRQAMSSLDPTRGSARLTFDRAPCEPIGDETLYGALLNRAAVLMSFEQVGGADRCLELARDYAKLRYAFGRPIGGQQAIKHKLADMYVNNQIARSNAYYGAWALETDAPELAAAAAAARVAASEAFWYASRESIQTHGGVGFTWEADCHLYYRRSLHTGLVLGSAASWSERLTSAVEALGTGAR